jgi:hypothetical protein
MTIVLVLVIVVLVIAIVPLSLAARHGRERATAPPLATSPARILMPFVAHGLAPEALDAALRLARAEGGTLVPVFLARVALHLPLDAPLPRQSQIALPIQEAIELRGVAFGVPVDSRVERGRSLRHALRETIAHERYDRLVIAAANERMPGFRAEDIAWLLTHAPGEIIVVRPDPGRPLSSRAPSAPNGSGTAVERTERAETAG